MFKKPAKSGTHTHRRTSQLRDRSAQWADSVKIEDYSDYNQEFFREPCYVVGCARPNYFLLRVNFWDSDHCSQEPLQDFAPNLVSKPHEKKSYYLRASQNF